MATREPIPQGTLDLLVLRTLDRDPELHGFEIAEAIGQRSGDVFQVEEGSLYPALQRMMVRGWISGTWGRTAENRRARYYRITAQGQRQLTRELTSYRRHRGHPPARLTPCFSPSGGGGSCCSLVVIAPDGNSRKRCSSIATFVRVRCRRAP